MPRNKRYDLHPEARREIEEAYSWYAERSLDATVGFLTNVDEGLACICENPNRWPKYLYDTRRYILDNFPYSVVYLEQPDHVTVIAVAHHKRRPGYWESRL